MYKNDQYAEVESDIVEYFTEIEKGFSFALDFDYLFQSNTKQKKLITIKKVPDNYAVLLKSNIIVTVNCEFFDKLENDDEIRKILFEQEIDKILPNLEKGNFKISQPTMKTSLGIVNKYTFEKVEHAQEIEKALSKQKEETEEK